MGNTVSSTIPSTATAGIDSYVGELGDVHYERSLGSARFLKTIRGRHREGPVVVKIFVKPDPTASLRRYVQGLKEENIALAEVPNAYAYQQVLETEKAGYLIRQYFFSNLYDRISTRPFLNSTEKKWIAYQLLRGTADAHARGVYHGDIKTENVAVTSWNWVYLTDFAGFKPTFLPEDNPADFSFFYDTSSRRTCYLAPERFYGPSDEVEKKLEDGSAQPDRKLTVAMDVFSLGCVIAELFLEGTHIFTLSQILRYRRGEYDPNVALDKIDDPDIREMIKHMIQLDPAKRLTAEKYLAAWRGKAFPNYFYTFLHQYIASITDPNSFSATSSPQNMGIGADARIERIHQDFDKIAFFLGFYGQAETEKENQLEYRAPTRRFLGKRRSESINTIKSNALLPVNLNIPNYNSHTMVASSPTYNKEDGAVIFLSLICASIRNTLYPSTRLYALDLLLAIGEHLSDEIRLDRLVPYMIALLGDEVGLVRAATMKALTQLLEMVQNITPINCTIFPEYILPNIRRSGTDPEVFVRTTYATCIASLAETALRFLELGQNLKNEGPFPAELDDENEREFEATYDTNLHDLQSLIQEQVTTLLIDPESSVKRALLSGITRLCVCFGRQKANDVLLSHMITYLNDRDWMLRCAFFESIVGVGTFVGGKSLEEYILPLMVQALTDHEEFVVEKVLNSLTALAELGLFQKPTLQELVCTIAPLVCHPSIWVRYGAVAFIASSATLLPAADIWCIVYPIVRPFLRVDVVDFKEMTLLENVKAPLSRLIFDQALTYASRSGSDFLSQSRRTVGRGVSDEEGQDEHVIRLRELGMSVEDEAKLFAMREYIIKLSRSKHSVRPRSSMEEIGVSMENGIIQLKNLGVTPRTVFLTPVHSTSGNATTSSADKTLSITGEDETIRLRPDRKSPTRSNRSQTLQGRLPSHAPDSRLLEQVTASTAPQRKSATDLSESQSAIRIFAPSKQEKHEEGSSSSSLDIHFSTTPISPSLSIVGSVGSLGSKDEPLSLCHRRKKPLYSMTPSMCDNLASGPSKAAAAISMTTENVTATMELPSGHRSQFAPLDAGETNSAFASLSHTVGKDTAAFNESSAATMPPISPWESNFYDGSDRSLKTLLRKKAMEAFPAPLPELGPRIAPSAIGRHRRPSNRQPNPPSLQKWRPEGTLIGHFTEHQESVNQIAVAPDHSFFATASDDGTVKIWDCMRLEKNVTNRSWATYSQQGGKITCITFIENTYSIASASDNGTIHVFRIDYFAPGAAQKYRKCRVVRKTRLENDYAVAINYINTDLQSLLVCATAKGWICAIDLRTMKAEWKLRNPPHYGVLTCFVIDRRNAWLLSGTSRGVLTLWDIRFLLPLRSWTLPSRSRIQKLVLRTAPAGKGRSVLVAAGKCEISVWDIESGECKEIYAAGGHNTSEERSSLTVADLFKALPAPRKGELGNAMDANEGLAADNAIRAVLNPTDCAYMITAGADRKIRYWDESNIEMSYVIAGLNSDEKKPMYSERHLDQILLHLETPTTPPARSSGSAGNTRSSSSSSTARANPVTTQQQSLLWSHLDCITDVQVTEVPYPILISADRDGVIKAWR